MKIGGRLFIILIAIYSIIIIIQAAGMPIQSEYTIGPGFVPLFIAIFSVITCIILMMQTFQGKTEQDNTKAGDVSKAITMVNIKAFVNSGAFKRVAGMVIAVVVAVLSMSYLGLIIPAFVFLIFAFHFIEGFKWFTTIRVSLTTIVVLYIIFVVWLGVQIPTLFKYF